MSHIVRLRKDPNHHVVMHCHATHTLALTYVLPEDEDEITRTLWRMSTECIVVFPEGIGYTGATIRMMQAIMQKKQRTTALFFGVCTASSVWATTLMKLSV